MVRVASWGLLIYLAAQRSWELERAKKNERAMRAAGGKEHSGGHYPVLFAFHVIFFLILTAKVRSGAYLGLRSLPWLIFFAGAQALRYWAVGALGPAWSTRIWTVPGRVLVRTGPYRFLRHPIYLAVVLEVFCVPMAYDLVKLAFAFSAINAVLLAVRIPAEQRALGNS